jgi:hypothetical protein
MLSVAACREDGVRRSKDTEGRSFEVTCAGERCTLKLVGQPAGTDPSQVVLSHAGRLVGACDVPSPDSTPQDSDCRALACSSEQDCPPLYGLEQGQCLNGLCIDAANPLGPADAVMLCLAGTGLGRKAPIQIERYALALNCGNPCRIPGPCRQP